MKNRVSQTTTATNTGLGIHLPTCTYKLIALFDDFSHPTDKPISQCLQDFTATSLQVLCATPDLPNVTKHKQQDTVGAISVAARGSNVVAYNSPERMQKL